MDVEGDNDVTVDYHEDRTLSPQLMSSHALQKAVTDALSPKLFDFENQVRVLAELA